MSMDQVSEPSLLIRVDGGMLVHSILTGLSTLPCIIPALNSRPIQLHVLTVNMQLVCLPLRCHNLIMQCVTE